MKLNAKKLILKVFGLTPSRRLSAHPPLKLRGGWGSYEPEVGRNGNFSSRISVFLILFIFFCASLPVKADAETPAPTRQSEIEEKWGVHIEGIKVSAAGYMLDFRYRVIDAEKAVALLDPRFKPFLMDQASGARFVVPAPAKIGPLRQTNRGGKPIAGRTYFILFANPGKYVKPGNKVSVNIGEFMAKDMTVR